VTTDNPADASCPAQTPTLETSLDFEATIRELGQIVEQLERGDLPLEQSLDLFERGMCLSKHAQTRLDAAEKRVEMLLGFNDQEQPVTRELDPAAR